MTINKILRVQVRERKEAEQVWWSHVRRKAELTMRLAGRLAGAYVALQLFRQATSPLDAWYPAEP